MRNTKQRTIILNIVNNSSSHLTAYEVYLECRKYLSNISLGTVYRNLGYLSENDFIMKIKMPDNMDRFDKKIVHAHIFCKICGCIDDINEDFIKTLPKISNYEVVDYDLCFKGICKKCLEKEKKHGIKRI